MICAFSPNGRSFLQSALPMTLCVCLRLPAHQLYIIAGTCDKRASVCSTPELRSVTGSFHLHSHGTVANRSPFLETLTAACLYGWYTHSHPLLYEQGELHPLHCHQPGRPLQRLMLPQDVASKPSTPCQQMQELGMPPSVCLPAMRGRPTISSSPAR
jgi:hypothetical protein